MPHFYNSLYGVISILVNLKKENRGGIEKDGTRDFLRSTHFPIQIFCSHRTSWEMHSSGSFKNQNFMLYIEKSTIFLAAAGVISEKKSIF